jgi:stage II sporulation protein E
MVEGTSHIRGNRIGNRAAMKHHRSNMLDRLKVVITNTTFISGVLGFFIGRVPISNIMAPFGIAFLMSTALNNRTKNNAIIGTCIVIGLLTRPWDYETIQVIVCLILIFISIVIFKIDNKTPVIKAAVIAFMVSFLVTLSSMLVSQGAFILDDMLTAIFNSTIVMALVYIYNYCLPVIGENKKRGVLSNEEIICLSILCGIVISGMSDIFIYGVSLKVALSVFAIASAAYWQGPGFGAAAGTTVGLITCVSSSQAPYILGMYALAGLLGGIFKDMGRVGGCLGIIIADIVIYLYPNSRIIVIKPLELAVGLIIFMLLPSAFVKKVLPFVDKNIRDLIGQQSYAERMKDIAASKIRRVINVFNELSKALNEDESGVRLRRNSEINSVINSVVDKTCADCEARDICWKRDFYRTYQNMFALFDVIESDGKVDIDNLPVDLKKTCVKANQLVKTANYMFDIYRMNYKWSMKAQEGKKVVEEQLMGISKILSSLSGQIESDVQFSGDIEEEIAAALDREGIDFNDIAAVKDKFGRMEVNIYREACLGKRECIKDIVPVVSRTLKRNMKRDKQTCVIKSGTDLCYFKLVEAVKYQISMGIARDIKDAGGVSGDNYSFTEFDNDKYMIALSDGMGTGPTAAMESNSAITMLEKYLEAGFDRITAIKAINSAMALKSSVDNYTTIDLCMVDLYTGEAEIVKIGAASTYIKRCDGSCEMICSSTLPVGILDNIDIESRHEKLLHGDLIVMLSDGVQEAGGSSDKDWILTALEQMDSKNPQQIAEELLRMAKERNGGDKLDDMTVLVSRIWEVA